jgi:hypothetical protein
MRSARRVKLASHGTFRLAGNFRAHGPHTKIHLERLPPSRCLHMEQWYSVRSILHPIGLIQCQIYWNWKGRTTHRIGEQSRCSSHGANGINQCKSQSKIIWILYSREQNALFTCSWGSILSSCGLFQCEYVLLLEQFFRFSIPSSSNWQKLNIWLI